MRIGTDDEIYRVDAVWLGPPKATFPFRARYVAWGVGLVTWVVIFALARRWGIEVSFFSIAWSVVIAIVLTRLICSKISHERPLGAVVALWLGELRAPTPGKRRRRGTAMSVQPIRVSLARPRPRRAPAAKSTNGGRYGS
ncbi:hypothetical protein ABT324_30770 [Saccharopolyspora sp. NPDC000359]|uniref:hypothetical protein n=1 Tax=Saccharopolyspora sp. NPDC000359 TaxID=3154251 RepID=UPI003330A087